MMAVSNSLSFCYPALQLHRHQFCLHKLLLFLFNSFHFRSVVEADESSSLVAILDSIDVDIVGEEVLVLV